MTFVCVDEAIEDTRLEIRKITITNSNNAEPKKEAKNVLKNDFIFYYYLSLITR